MLERLVGAVFTLLGFALVIAGLLMKVPSGQEWLFHVWLLAVVIFVLIVPEGNRLHDEYQLPFVPVGAVLRGKALARLSEGPGIAGIRSLGMPRIALALVFGALAILSNFYAAPLFVAQPYYVAQYEIGREVDHALPLSP